MEINLNNRLKRNAQITRTEVKAENSKSSSKASDSTEKYKSDRLELSKQILSVIDAQNRRSVEQQARKNKNLYPDSSSADSQRLDSLEKSLKVMNKCQKIAARIMAGDRVPPEDMQYLLENDPEGYKLAMAARKPKKDPKEWDSVLEDEDRKGSSVDSASSPSGSSAAETTPEASESSSAAE